MVLLGSIPCHTFWIRDNSAYKYLLFQVKACTNLDVRN